MYLSDYLHEIPLKALKRIAGHLGVSVEYQARIKLMNAIDRAFWDGSLFSRLAQGLTDIARLILSIVAFSYDAGIRESALLRKMERLTGARRREVRDILDELILSVLVGGVKYEEPVYFCPRGIAEQARIILLKDFVVPPSSEQPAFSPFPSLMEDIIALLAAAYREPVPLTQKKHIRRNVLEKTFAGSLTGKDAPEHFSAEHRDSFVTGYLSARNLMHLGDRSATVTPALDGWLGLSMTERIQDAVSFALMYVLGDIQTIVPFAGIISELPIGASFEPSVLAKFLHERTTASGNVSRLAGRIWQMASILNYLGLLLYREGRFVMTGAGSGFFHGEPLPIDKNNADQFTLQPNFETLAGPELDLRTRFTLELMSYRKSRDVVITSVVNRRGVARARERGMSVGQIMSFFETHSRTPVPQNIRFSIEN